MHFCRAGAGRAPFKTAAMYNFFLALPRVKRRDTLSNAVARAPLWAFHAAVPTLMFPSLRRQMEHEHDHDATPVPKPALRAPIVRRDLRSSYARLHSSCKLLSGPAWRPLKFRLGLASLLRAASLSEPCSLDGVCHPFTIRGFTGTRRAVMEARRDLRRMPKGERCPECGSQKWYLQDGLRFCARGHQIEVCHARYDPCRRRSDADTTFRASYSSMSARKRTRAGWALWLAGRRRSESRRRGS